MSLRAVARTLLAAMAVGLLVGCQEEPTPSPTGPVPAATAAVAATSTITAVPTRTPSPAAPDLTPPPGGWIAYVTSDDRLALVSPDGTRRLSPVEASVRRFAWSPDGRRLAFSTGEGGLSILSMGDARLTEVSDSAQEDLAWSVDSLHLAYLHDVEPRAATQKRGAVASAVVARMYEVATGQTITVVAYGADFPFGSPYPGPALCPQPCPRGQLQISTASVCGGRVHVWLWQDDPFGIGEFVTAGIPCSALWQPEGKGIVFPQSEAEKAPLYPQLGGQCDHRPVSLAYWQARGGQQRVLEASDREQIWPERWLTDGRLEVRVEEYPADESGSVRRMPEPSVRYRYFDVSGAGEFKEVDAGELPWWAGGGFARRVKEAGLEAPSATGYCGWSVGPDGETVLFYSWSSVYVWNGDGGPRSLGQGQCPKWQPTVPTKP